MKYLKYYLYAWLVCALVAFVIVAAGAAGYAVFLGLMAISETAGFVVAICLLFITVFAVPVALDEDFRRDVVDKGAS